MFRRRKKKKPEPTTEELLEKARRVVDEARPEDLRDLADQALKKIADVR